MADHGRRGVFPPCYAVLPLTVLRMSDLVGKQKALEHIALSGWVKIEKKEGRGDRSHMGDAKAEKAITGAGELNADIEFDCLDAHGFICTYVCIARW